MTFESLVNDVKNEHSEIYLRLYLNELKLTKEKRSDSRTLGFVSFFVSIASLCISLKEPIYASMPLIFILFIISPKIFTNNEQKLSTAIFIIEQALLKYEEEKKIKSSSLQYSAKKGGSGKKK